MELLVREINSVDDLAAVYGLTYREYVQLNYIQPNPTRKFRQYYRLDKYSGTTVFGAYLDGSLVGTNSLTVDGQMGLHVDHDFPDTVGRIRRWCRSRGMDLGASWRIVTDSSVRNNFRILVELVRATIRKGCQLGLHVTLYSFHPRHEKTYRRFLGLQTIARDVCRAAGGAPAVLMYGDSRIILSHCPQLRQPCFGKCKPPIWPALAGQWKGE